MISDLRPWSPIIRVRRTVDGHGKSLELVGRDQAQVIEASWPKVEQQPNLEIRRSQITQELTGGASRPFTRRLGLDDKSFVHDHVHAVCRELETLVEDADIDFTTHAVTSGQEFTLE